MNPLASVSTIFLVAFLIQNEKWFISCGASKYSQSKRKDPSSCNGSVGKDGVRKGLWKILAGKIIQGHRIQAYQKVRKRRSQNDGWIAIVGGTHISHVVENLTAPKGVTKQKPFAGVRLNHVIIRGVLGIRNEC